jgi:hypothetical protein
MIVQASALGRSLPIVLDAMAVLANSAASAPARNEPSQIGHSLRIRLQNAFPACKPYIDCLD